MDNKGEKGSLPHVPLKKLYLGDVDGSKEASKGDLMALFYELNDIVEQVKNPDYYYILGWKGCGKTYLAYYFKRLADDYENCTCEVINTIDAFKLRKKIETIYCHTDISSEDLELFWEWIILYQLSTILIKDITFFEKLLKNVPINQLYRFINALKDWDEGLNQVLDCIIEETVANNISAEIAAGIAKSGLTHGHTLDTKKHIARNECFNLIEPLREMFYQVAEKNTQNITLFYDEIDNVENTNLHDNKFYRSLVISLINTCSKLNLKLSHLDIKIITIIRSDIINKLQPYSSNLNKIADSVVELDWTSSKHNYSHPMMDLILTKIKNTQEAYKDISKKQLYYELFDYHIMGMTPTDYLLSMGRGRPREAIKYLNIIKFRYGEAATFKEKYFRNTRLQYSRWLFSEIQNEMAIYFEGEFINEIFMLLRNFRRKSFYINQIQEYFEANSAKYKTIEDIKESIPILYEFSVIGNKVLKDDRILGYRKATERDYQFLFKHHSRECLINEKLIIHKGLQPVLQLR